MRFPEFEGEWGEYKLRDVIQMFSGGTPPMQFPDYWNGNIPLISAISMHNTYISSSTQYITNIGLEKGSKLLQKENLLLLVRGSMLWNRIPICYNLIDVAFNQDVKGIVVNNKSTSLFVLYWFQSKETFLKSLVTGTGIGAGKLDSETIFSLQIALPNKIEQSKIAKILSLLDQRIATQNKIIEKYESLIKGISDLLLHNKNYSIESVNLGSLCSIKKGEQVNALELTDTGSYYVMNGGMLPSGYYPNYNTSTDTISISEGGNSCGYVQYNSSKFWSGGHCYTLNEISNRIFNKYLYYYLKSQEKNIQALRVGSGLPNIQKKDLERFKIQFPNYEEQEKAVKILTQFSRKIEIEHCLLYVFQKQKEYLLKQMFI